MTQKIRYWLSVLIAIDQLANALLWGWPDETLSSRAYRDGVLDPTPKRRWIIIHKAINALFRDPSHCKDSYLSELNRTHLDGLTARPNQP